MIKLLSILFSVVVYAQTYSGGTISVYYSPHGGCTSAIIAEINKAKSSVHMSAYVLTSTPIAESMVSAHKRGVVVEAVIDGRHSPDSDAVLMMHTAGIPVWLDTKHAIMHNKIVIVDAKITITGSFNFSQSAETRNAENLLVIRNTGLSTGYIDSWKVHKSHSRGLGIVKFDTE